jgi:UDP-N-acetylglucosamine:LPS N-acetylglucosamine transferase
MPVRPGKYDDLATLVLTQAAADGVVVIVIGGAAGSGFSVQASPEIVASLPRLLRIFAAGIERDMAKFTDQQSA